MPVPALRDTVEPFWTAEDVESCLITAGRVCTSDFLDCLKATLKTRSPAWAYGSGRKALEAYLQLTVTPQRRTVLVSAFTCPVVADAVENVGGELEVYDFDDSCGSLHWDRLGEKLSPRHAAIVVPHLFGVPTDFRDILPAARRHNVHIIEDCAHTLGGMIGNQVAGTIGDASIFSFNYDKPISLAGGGILLVNRASMTPACDVTETTLSTERNEFQAYFKFAESRKRQIVPQPRITRYSIRLAERLLGRNRPRKPACQGIGPLRSALGIWQLEQYESIVKIRNKWATLLGKWNPGRSWHVGQTVKPSWLRQKIVPLKENRADDISHALRVQGLRVGRFNWPQSVGSANANPNAHFISQKMLDVPVHQQMTEDDLRTIQRQLEQIEFASRPAA